jgi:protein-S-isoprenylcysteine O-methyltransferase Ste14
MGEMSDALRSRIYATGQNLLLALFAAVVLFDRRPPLFASTAARDIGLGLCAIGIVLMLAAILALRRVIQIAPEPRPDGHLITAGVYALMRHPIYTAILLVVAGLFLRRPTTALAISAAAVAIFLFLKASFEERLLATRYPEYVEYCRRSWGLIPGFRR